jgi:dTDP-4-dehydrorhamnose reductase
MQELRKRGYQVTGWARTEVDITDPAAVERKLAEANPDVVFNAAAYNQVDVAEREPTAAYQVNALAVRNLALGCRQVDAQLVHFSTDYVFDGFASRPYTEEDPTHPLGAYAVSKLAGELYAQAYLERPLIVRTSGVFGSVPED